MHATRFITSLNLGTFLIRFFRIFKVCWLVKKKREKESKQIDLSLAFSSCNAKLTVSCVTGEKSPASFNTCIKWPHGMRWDLYESWQNSYGHSWSRHLEYQWHSPVSSFIYADEYISFVFSHVKKWKQTQILKDISNRYTCKLLSGFFFLCAYDGASHSRDKG